MHRQILIVIGFLLFSASMLAEDSLPVIEIKADRTMIYPQRMELTGEETLMDILQMMPDLMIVGYEDVISDYSLRIDNSPMNGDTRLILSQMKARDIARIQVCDNTGVAKGSIGMGKVLDINMVMPDSLEGFVEGQVGFGKDTDGNGTVNALYGSRHTDLYANASYRYRGGDNEYLTLTSPSSIWALLQVLRERSWAGRDTSIPSMIWVPNCSLWAVISTPAIRCSPTSCHCISLN